MQDLAANVTFEARPDGWALDQDADVITSVQAFLDGTELILELWGITTAVGPDGARHEARDFQQNSWIRLDDASWRARRLVRDLAENHPDEGLAFDLSGSVHDVERHRRP